MSSIIAFRTVKYQAISHIKRFSTNIPKTTIRETQELRFNITYTNKLKGLHLMHNSWSKSVLAQWKSTKAPGKAVSALSGLVVSCRKNKETLITKQTMKKVNSERQECDAARQHLELRRDIWWIPSWKAKWLVNSCANRQPKIWESVSVRHCRENYKCHIYNAK